jgi:hypothetical protein
MSETTEVHKCPVCDGRGITVNLTQNKYTSSIFNEQCKSCNGTGVIITDIVTPFSRESEQFEEIFEDIFLLFWPYDKIREIYLKEHYLYKVIKKYVGVGDRVKISCKPGCIKIERVEK